LPFLPQEFVVTQPTIRQWLTPAGFAAAVPDLAEFPLPAVSHALAMLRSTAVPVLDAPHAQGGPDNVYLVTPSHVLLIDAVRDDDPHGGRYVRLPAPLGGSAVGVPVPVVDIDTLLATLRGGVANGYLFPPATPPTTKGRRIGPSARWPAPPPWHGQRWAPIPVRTSP
jgi:hypothetical protein